MLNVETFDALRGGSVLYKALSHPLAAERLRALAASLNQAGPVAIYDPRAMAQTLLALMPRIEVEGIYVHDSLAVGQMRAGCMTRALTALGSARAATVLIAAFDADTLRGRVAGMNFSDGNVRTLDEVRLPLNLITNATRYLDALNFATNFAFFRDDDHFGTRLTTANYWSRYGARSVRLLLRLYDAGGRVLAQWEQALASKACGVVIHSAEVRRRFGLPPFIGQLFMHAIGATGHDVVKYTLDTFATDEGASLSCTHDANAWPSDRYAGLPAPLPGERVTLWLQNSHALPIPAGAIALDRMGAGAPVAISDEIPAFATQAVDVARYLPHITWPSQIELRAGRHVVRPRYEVTRDARTRIAHLNVERCDLTPDPQIRTLAADMGRGFLLPFPVLPRGEFRTIVQPTPMALRELNTPLRIDIFDANGARLADHFIGILPRRHEFALDLDSILSPGILNDGGHAELLYDFRNGGEANGWLHALFRYEHRRSGHVADSSFGAHIFNTLMTYRGEPQSYSGPAPGLSTRLYLKLAGAGREGFCVLIYPASASWRARSCTVLELYADSGDMITTRTINIPCSGSATVKPFSLFGAKELREAGAAGYVLVRDSTCRLFGFHGERTAAGSFSFDHMFGF